jgi:hypothetical protein
MSYLEMALQALDRNHREVIQPPLAPPERILTCFECGHYRPAAHSPNPTQAWGHCEKRGRGRYGVATACEAILTAPDGPASGEHKNG